MSTRRTNPKDILANSKAPLDFVPMSMVVYAAMQMKNGAAKYGSYNFRGTGVRASVYYAGMLRHLMDWFNGNEFDEEGVPNMAGLCANLAILADAYAHGYLVDDRPPRVDMRALFEQAEMEAVDSNARFEGKAPPRHYTIADETFEAGYRVTTEPGVEPEYVQVTPDRPAVDMHDAPINVANPFGFPRTSRYPQELLDEANKLADEACCTPNRGLPAGIRWADGV